MATMRGIDVSSHQGKIDPTKLPQVEFCITKATEGKTYVNPECDRVVQLCRKAGLPWGFYHYARNNDPAVEADFFVSSCWNYFGEGIPVLDWEEDQSVEWVNKFLQRVYDKTCVWCWVYANAWRFDQGTVNRHCDRWVARYPNVLRPSIEWSLPERPKVDGLICAWQFASDGKVDGYNGKLDVDVFYGGPDQWRAYARGDRGDADDTAPLPSITVEDENYRVDITRK